MLGVIVLLRVKSSGRPECGVFQWLCFPDKGSNCRKGKILFFQMHALPEYVITLATEVYAICRNGCGICHK